jgi:hypothetical protein
MAIGKDLSWPLEKICIWPQQQVNWALWQASGEVHVIPMGKDGLKRLQSEWSPAPADTYRYALLS